MNTPIPYPQSSQREFLCYHNRISLDEYRRNSTDSDEPTLDRFAGMYDEVTYDEYNHLFVVEKDGKLNLVFERDLWMFFEADMFVPVIYDFCHLYPGFAVVRKGNQVGNLFFHEGFSEPETYQTVDIFEVKRGGFFGVETASGDTVLACTFRYVKIYPEFILAWTSEGYLFFHPDGTKMFDGYCFNYVDLRDMHTGNQFIFVQEKGLWGVVHLAGHWIVPAVFLKKDEIQWEYYPYFCCKLYGKEGLYNEWGELIIPFEYDEIEHSIYFRPYPFIVTQNGKQGLIDVKGNILFPCIYDQIICIGYLYRMLKDGNDALWEIPVTDDNHGWEPNTQPVTFSQILDSSCCDLYKVKQYAEEMLYEYEFSRMKNDGDEDDEDNDDEEVDVVNDQKHPVNEKEAKRWQLLCRAFYDADYKKLYDDDDDNNYDYNKIYDVDVENLTDQGYLTYISVMDENSERRKNAVRKLTDQDILAAIAIYDEYGDVRDAAVNTLSDQDALAHVAKNVHDIDVCKAALKKLTDPNILADLANDKEWSLRKAVMSKLFHT